MLPFDRNYAISLLHVERIRNWCRLACRVSKELLTSLGAETEIPNYKPKILKQKISITKCAGLLLMKLPKQN